MPLEWSYATGQPPYKRRSSHTNHRRWNKTRAGHIYSFIKSTTDATLININVNINFEEVGHQLGIKAHGTMALPVFDITHIIIVNIHMIIINLIIIIKGAGQLVERGKCQYHQQQHQHYSHHLI